MPSTRSKTARRREVRRHLPRGDTRWWVLLRRREWGWAGLFVLLFAVGATLIAWPEGTRHRYEPGDLITSPITSRVAFETIDREATLRQREEARSREPRIYVANEPYLHHLRQRLAGLLSLAEHESVDELPRDFREEHELTAEGLEALRGFAADEEQVQAWQELSDQFVQQLFDLAILAPEPYAGEREQERGMGGIIIRHPDPRQEESPRQLRFPNAIYSVDDTAALLENLRQSVEPFPEELRSTILALVVETLEPTYVYNTEAQELTEQRREERYEREPPVIRTIERGETLVAAGETLSEEQRDLLEQERQAYRAGQSPLARAGELGGLAGLMLVIGLGLWAYILNFNDRVARNPVRGLALSCLLLGGQALAVVSSWLLPEELIYNTAVLPSLLVGIVLTIVYERRFAMALGAIHLVVVAITLDLALWFMLVPLAGLAVGTGLLREVRTRSTIVRVGFLAGLMMGAVVLLAGLFYRPLYLEGEWTRVLYDALHAIGAGLIAGLVVQGILPSIEKAFKVTTAMTLRELNDASHPLLQQLAQAAPGTFQHSLRIADMAEAAAEAIGADALLCRVGAMYHDIGKVNKPQYFIENQSGGPNRHNKLSPAMSLLIIVGHVKDGIEMAREYRLPQPIIHFIESHHGTTLVEYFYHAARKKKEAEETAAPSEFEFRYPGPKPQTREAAIMLLCDSVEAAARSLPEPTPVRLEQVAQRIARKRLMDGQFDECNLTLQELNNIEQAVTKMLCAIYHGRVKYPGSGGTAEPAPPPRREPAETPRPEPAAS